MERRKMLIVIGLRLVGLLMAVFARQNVWLVFLGLGVFFLASLVFPQERPPATERALGKFAAYSSLLTGGVALILCGVTWLEFCGVWLVIASTFFSRKTNLGRRHISALLIGFAGTFYCLLHDRSHPFQQSSEPLWMYVIVLGAWVWQMGREYWAFQYAVKRGQIGS